LERVTNLDLLRKLLLTKQADTEGLILIPFGLYQACEKRRTWQQRLRVLRADVEAFDRQGASVRGGKAPKGLAAGIRRERLGPAAKGTGLKDMLSLAAKQARSEDRRKWAPVHDAVRTEFARLRGEGFPKTKAALAIVSDRTIREKIQTVAKAERVHPWRGDFYSLTAVRKLVGGSS
jgi:hypothetical protein